MHCTKMSVLLLWQKTPLNLYLNGFIGKSSMRNLTYRLAGTLYDYGTLLISTLDMHAHAHTHAHTLTLTLTLTHTITHSHVLKPTHTHSLVPELTPARYVTSSRSKSMQKKTQITISSSYCNGTSTKYELKVHIRVYEKTQL